MVIHFDEGIVERTKRAMHYVKEHEAEISPRTITVELKKEDNFLSTATRPGSDLKWYSDLSKERGGGDKGTSPLTYFLSSMGFCQFIHYAEHSMVDGLRLTSLAMKLDGVVVEQRPRRFTGITYEVRINSFESDEAIRRLAKNAAEDCYVTNTLKRSCSVTGIIVHNDKIIDEHH